MSSPHVGSTSCVIKFAMRLQCTRRSCVHRSIHSLGGPLACTTSAPQRLFHELNLRGRKSGAEVRLWVRCSYRCHGRDGGLIDRVHPPAPETLLNPKRHEDVALAVGVVALVGSGSRGQIMGEIACLQAA